MAACFCDANDIGKRCVQETRTAWVEPRPLQRKRAADDNGLNSFVKAMHAGASELNVAASMLSSNEFVAQV
jgi:hypothetical protein